MKGLVVCVGRLGLTLAAAALLLRCGGTEPDDPQAAGGASGGVSGASSGNGGDAGSSGDRDSAAGTDDEEGGTSAGGTAGSAGGDGGAGSDGSSGAAGSAGDGSFLVSPSRGRVSAGARHACVVTADTGVACWGAGGDAVNDAPTDTGYDRVIAGGANSCALRVDGTLACWGDLESPELEPLKFVSIGSSGCGVTADDGTLVCWPETFEPPPGAPIGAQPGFTRITTPSSRALCALDEAGTVHCWTEPGEPIADVPSGSFIDVVANARDACALTAEGIGHCWGSNVALNLEASGRPYRQLVPGQGVVCAVLPDRTAACYGLTSVFLSYPPPNDVEFVEISVGGEIACGIATNGDVHCWGNPNLPGLDKKPAGLKALMD